MAAPSYGSQSDGGTDAGGAWTAAGTNLSQSAGTLVILQIFQDGSTAGAVAATSFSNVENLAGTDSAMTSIGSFNVGSPTAGIQHLWIGRHLNVFNPSASGTNSTSEDLYYRWYSFTDTSTGTTLGTVIENGTAGSTANGVGTTSAGDQTVADTGVTTLGPDRLALQFVALNDDIAIDAFAGESGGDWAEAVAEYAEASGTDGCIQLQTATITSAATINGGSDSIATNSIAWGVVGFALIGTTPSTPIPRYGFVHYNDPALV